MATIHLTPESTEILIQKQHELDARDQTIQQLNTQLEHLKQQLEAAQTRYFHLITDGFSKR